MTIFLTILSLFLLIFGALKIRVALYSRGWEPLFQAAVAAVSFGFAAWAGLAALAGWGVIL